MIRRALPLAIVAVLGGACASPGPWTRAAVLGPARTRIDSDHDGKVSATEYDRVAWHAPAFTEADADGDGNLELTELDTLVKGQDPLAFAEARQHPRPDPAPGGPGGGQNPPGEGKPGPMGPPPADGQPAVDRARFPEPPEVRAQRLAQSPTAPEGGPPPGAPTPPGGPGAKDGPPPGAGGPPGKDGPPAGGPDGKDGDIKRKHVHGLTWLALGLLREEVLAKDPAAAVPSPDEILVADAAGGLDTLLARAALGKLEAASAAAGLAFPPSLAQAATAPAAPPGSAAPP
jgi:hypothetical protein